MSIGIQIAFKIELITDGYVWIDVLNKRDLIANTYDQNKASEAEEFINYKYYLTIKKFLEKLENM